MEITAAFIDELLLSSTPNSLLIPMIRADIKKNIRNIDNRDHQNELNILSNFYTQLVSFGKTRLFLSNERLIVLFQIGQSLISAGCYQQISGQSPSVEEVFNLLTRQVTESRFTPSSKRSIIDYFTESYFKHFRLYSHIFGNKQKSETLYINVWVDSPLPSLPLHMSVQRLKHNDINSDEPINFADQFSRSSSKIAKISRPSSRRGSFINQKSSHPMMDEVQGIATSAFPSESPKPVLTKFDSTIKKYQDSMQEDFDKHQQLIETQLEEIKKKIGK